MLSNQSQVIVICINDPLLYNQMKSVKNIFYHLIKMIREICYHKEKSHCLYKKNFKKSYALFINRKKNFTLLTILKFL